MGLTIDIKEQLDQLNKDWIVLMETPQKIANDVSLESIKHLVNNQEYIGIILTASKPYITLKKQYEEKGIDTNRIIFIDCISKTQFSEIEQAGNVVYIDAVYNLTKISLAFKKIITQVEGKIFLYVDSLSAMLIHNTSEVFIRFIHGLITTMRLSSISGLLLSLHNQTNEQVKIEVSNLCDKTIVIE